MSVQWWVVLVGVLVAVVLLGGVAYLIGRERRAVGGVDTLSAEAEDQPVAAVVVNPTKIVDGTRERITAVCTNLGWAEPLWLETTAEDPGTGQTRIAVDKGVDVVLACGGDGTVRSVAQALAGTGVTMGLLPQGTGNLLARTLDTPLELELAVRMALTGDDRPIDVGMISIDDSDEEHVFLVMAGTGFDAAIMESTPEDLKSRVGPLAYVVSGLKAMRGRRMRVTLTIDGGEPMRRRTRTVLVGNSGTLLGGLVLMPQAVIDDGHLDVVSLAPKGLTGWVAVAARVISRRRGGHERVEHWEAREIVVETEEPQPSQIDGDPVGEASRLRIRVNPGALIVRVPDTDTTMESAALPTSPDPAAADGEPD